MIMPLCVAISWWLTHWGREIHICVIKLTIIGLDNGLSPGRHQAIIWTNAGILLIEPFGTKFNEILIEIHTFSFKEMHLKMSFAKWQPFCPGLNVLTQWSRKKMANILQIIFTNVISRKKIFPAQRALMQGFDDFLRC